MPFYEYECPDCGFRDEVLQQISEKPLKKCPNCGKSRLKKLMSAPVFRLKGSGWYETDFKSDKENKRNLAGADKEESKAETKPEAKAEGKAEGNAEAKPETKADAKADAPKAQPVKPAPKNTKPKPKARTSAPKRRRG
jgi:putative FmdB family regulatory protein